MSFQLQAVVALVSARNERIDGGREVHLAASDAQIDVADDGITQMHMPDSAVKAADCIDLVITARNDVAEVQYGADGLISKRVVQHLGPLDGGAQAPRMRCLHEQTQPRAAELLRCCGKSTSYRRDVARQLGAWLGALLAARQHDCGRTDGLGQVNQSPESTLHLSCV